MPKGYRKTQEEHVQAIAVHGRVQLVGEFKTVGSRTLYRCIEHGEVHEARSQFMEEGGGLPCCSKTRLKTRDEHITEIAIHGRVELIGDYVKSNVKTTYRCIEHGEIHEALPNHMRVGGTLPCCNPFRPKSREEHIKELAVLGHVELVGDYKRRNIKTMYRCLKHGEEHLSTPSVVLKGHGLACCMRNRTGQKHPNFVRKRDLYDKRLAEIGRVVRVEEYLGARKWFKHRCLIHDEVHLGLPSNLLKGHGLVCCRETGDSFERALTGTGRFAEEVETDLYVYNLLNHPGYLKIGISKEHEGRANGEYGDCLGSWRKGSRTLAFILEQALLRITKSLRECPVDLDGFKGSTEIRKMDPGPLLDLADDLSRDIDRYSNPWEFALIHGLLTRDKRKRAEALVRAGEFSEASFICQTL